jgi:hypothetical protein
MLPDQSGFDFHVSIKSRLKFFQQTLIGKYPVDLDEKRGQQFRLRRELTKIQIQIRLAFCSHTLMEKFPADFDFYFSIKL